MDECEVVLDQKIETTAKVPSKYKVIFINDSETPFEWVVVLLVRIFNYSSNKAEEMANLVDMQGFGVVGIYTFEIAEQKASEGVSLSRSNGYPLEIKIEKV